MAPRCLELWALTGAVVLGVAKQPSLVKQMNRHHYYCDACAQMIQLNE
jgi:hypothetical protein